MSNGLRKSIQTYAEKTPKARTFRFRISDGSVDRDRDTIDPRGWRLMEYKRNPVVLWQHNWDMPPIGRTIDIGVISDALVAEAEFPPPGIYELADQIHDLVAAGYLTSASVGFIPERREYVSARDGHDIREATLLEWSIVNVPANVQAQIERSAGRNCDQVAVKNWLGAASSYGRAPSGDTIIAGSDAEVGQAVKEIREEMVKVMHEHARSPRLGRLIEGSVQRGVDRIRGRIVDEDLTFELSVPPPRGHRSSERTLEIDATPAEINTMMREVARGALGNLDTLIAKHVTATLNRLRGRID